VYVIRTVAVLSDVHGVLPALDAVLAEPDVAAADLVVVTGDHAAGPQPVQVLDRLLGLGERLLLVRGNADRELVELALHPRRARDPELPGAVAVDRWAADQLRPDQVELLAGLPHPVTVDVERLGPVLFCHGTPRDDDEVVLVDTRPARWAEAFADVPAQVRIVLCGHTHMPFSRLLDRRLVVNSGSVGMPYGHAGASWALVGPGGVALRRTTFDPRAAADAVVAGSTYPERVEWTREYLLTPASDIEALAAFGPRDGR